MAEIGKAKRGVSPVCASAAQVLGKSRMAQMSAGRRAYLGIMQARNHVLPAANAAPKIRSA